MGPMGQMGPHGAWARNPGPSELAAYLSKNTSCEKVMCPLLKNGVVSTFSENIEMCTSPGIQLLGGIEERCIQAFECGVVFVEAQCLGHRSLETLWRFAYWFSIDVR